MRSRYTAYTQIDIGYIACTMKPPATNHFDAASARAWAEKVSWTHLNVIRTTCDKTQGIVEFCASYRMNGESHLLHEISTFHFENGKWYYVDGTEPQKTGRNDPCPCGSFKKYKRCCGNTSIPRIRPSLNLL